MQELIDLEINYLHELKDIPKTIHNIQLSEQQIKRLRQGLKTNLIEGITLETGETINAKLKASKNKGGDIVIDYHIQREELEIPTTILGKKLTDKQMASLFDGELINFSFKNKSYYIGIDNDLNKITIETDRTLSIPERFGNYTLDNHDKLMLANGKTTNERLFKTGDGKYYLARLSFTDSKKGMEILNIKSISIERALEIEKTVNKPIDISKTEASLGDITDDTLKYFSATDGFKKDLNEDKGEKIIEVPLGTRIERSGKPIHKKNKRYNQFNVLNTDINNNIVELKADKVVTPPTFKGVKLTTLQKQNFENFEKVKIVGATNHLGENQDVNIWKTKDNKFNMEWLKPPVKNSKSKSKEQAIDIEHTL